MSGLNRFYLTNESDVTWRKNAGIKCVFISHQKDDASVCRKIADYLINAGLDVYFDEYDTDLKKHWQTNNPKYLVDSIKKGTSVPLKVAETE